MTQQQLHIVESVESTQNQTSEREQQESKQFPTPDAGLAPYEEASEIDGRLAEVLGSASSRQRRRQRTRFVRAVADEVGKDEIVQDVRVLDELEVEDTDDVDLGTLLAFPDDSIMFVGIDPTARDSVPLFAFTVERHQPIPAPSTAKEALDLLRPGAVRDAFETEDREPDRQGEWWLLPTRKVPVGSTFTPGVASRPFGPSPLGNHVPREYGFAVTDAEFMGVRERIDELPKSITTPPEVINWLHRQRSKVPTPDYVPTWEEVREIAGEVYVRGTLRHRENDHFVEDVGDQWHEAITHDLDVYTGDEMVDRVVLD